MKWVRKVLHLFEDGMIALYVSLGKLKYKGTTFMKQYFFPLFITTLGLFTAYVFYALWHSEEVNFPEVIESPKERVIEDLANKEIIPKSTLSVPETSLDTHSQAADEKEMQEMMENQENIPNLTPKQMQAQTEAVYDSLTPDDYEETMEEANAAFDALDNHVEALDAKLAEEMQDIEEAQEEQIDSDDIIEEEPQEEMVMTVPENEEEIDMEYEDMNNL